MFEVVKIICRILSGLIPIIWVFSWWMFLKKNKFEETCGVLSMSLILIGIVDCVITAIGLM